MRRPVSSGFNAYNATSSLTAKKKLSEIVFDLVYHVHGCYITENGLCLKWGSNAPDTARVGCYSYPFRRPLALPKEVQGYLRRKGVLRSIREKKVSEARLTLRRLSDEKEEKFTLADFRIKFMGGDKKRFHELGFYVPNWTPQAWGFSMKAEDYIKLADFLLEAGIRFKFDIPPWMEAEVLAAKVKPSSRRPGEDAARFFGF